MSGRGRLLAFLCAGLCWLLLAMPGAPLHAQGQLAETDGVAAIEVWLATIEPGELYWQRFGHNAIVLREPVSGRGVSYNFGYFDFAQQDFLLRFIRGRMLYQAVALDADADIAGYLEEGRRVWMQRLRLSAPATEALAAYLHGEVQPDRRHYRYDYYTINCSTRVRDALDQALSGQLKEATDHRSHGLTWRRYTRAYAQGVPWLYLGTDLGLGPAVDRPLSMWEEMFIPGELKRRLDELVIDGQPVVLESRVLPAGAVAEDVSPTAPDWRALFAAAGLLLAGCVLALLRWSERGGYARVPLVLVGGSLSLLMGGAGLLLAGLWLGTDHTAAWRNQNLLLLSPFWWFTLPAWWLLLWRDRISVWAADLARIATWLALAGVVVAALLKVFRSFEQVNIEWLLLLWPQVLALRYALARRRVLSA